MDTKKIISLLTVLLIGLGIGYFLNSRSTVEDHSQHQEEKATIWTCSMHSQIQLSEPGQCPICGMDLIPMNEGGAKNANPNAVVFNEGEIQQNNIQVIEAGTSVAEKTIRLDGKVKVNENNIFVQSSHYSGRIEALNIQYEGQLIKKGQLIAKIYSPELIKAQTELIETAKLKESNPSLFSAAKKKLAVWKISKKQIEGIIETSTVIEELPVYADHSGVITQLNLSLGNYIKKGQPLVLLANLSSVWVELDAFERDLEWLEIGQVVSLNIQTATNLNYEGKVSYIDPFLNAKSRTAKVRVELNNNGELKPEMFAVGKIIVENRTGEVLTVPKSAVLWTGERSIIYKEIEHHTFVLQQVTLGKDIGEFYEVRDGLNKGDRIVKSGTFVIDAAAQLQGKSSMMNQPERVVKNNHSEITNDSTIFQLYISATKALQANHEQHTKKLIGIILDSIPVLKEQHPHLLHKEGDQFKQDFSEFSLSIKATLPSTPKVYLLKCPMANSNKGGYWLSNKPTVDNPYFGGEMLTCGSIQAEQPTLEDVQSEKAEIKQFTTYHPLVVHFPIVLILLAFILHVLSYFVSWNIHNINLGIIVFGTVAAIAAAFFIHPYGVDGSPEQLAILQEHELLSYVTIAISALASFWYWKTVKNQVFGWKKITLTIILAMGSLFISLSGHHGAQLTHIEHVKSNHNH